MTVYADMPRRTTGATPAAKGLALALFAGFFIFMFGLLIGYVVYRRQVMSWLYGPLVHHCDLFIAAPLTGFLIGWMALTFLVLPLPLAAATLPRMTGSRSAGAANLRTLALGILGGWLLLTLCLWDVARNTYVRIDQGMIESKGIGTHFYLPLSQVGGVETTCRRSGKRNQYAHVHYTILVKGHAVDLLDPSDLFIDKSWSDTLDQVAAIDNKLKADQVSMQKLKPYDQLDAYTRGCLTREGLGDGSADTRKRQLIFG